MYMFDDEQAVHLSQECCVYIALVKIDAIYEHGLVYPIEVSVFSFESFVLVRKRHNEDLNVHRQYGEIGFLFVRDLKKLNAMSDSYLNVF